MNFRVWSLWHGSFSSIGTYSLESQEAMSAVSVLYPGLATRKFIIRWDLVVFWGSPLWLSDSLLVLGELAGDVFVSTAISLMPAQVGLVGWVVPRDYLWRILLLKSITLVGIGLVRTVDRRNFILRKSLVLHHLGGNSLVYQTVQCLMAVCPCGTM